MNLKALLAKAFLFGFFLIGVGTQTVEAAGIPFDMRMHLKFSDTRPEVKFTDTNWQDHKVKICSSCTVEVKNATGQTLYVSMSRVDYRLQFVVMADDMEKALASLTIKDGEGNIYSQNGINYENIQVHPVKSITVGAELDTVKEVNFINQYGGDLDPLNHSFETDWIVEQGQGFAIEMKPGQYAAPQTLQNAGYLRYDLDANSGDLLKNNSFLSFFQNGADKATKLPIHSGTTEIRVEGKAPQHNHPIPLRVQTWTSQQTDRFTLFIKPWDGLDPIYHPENYEWIRLTVTRGAVSTSYELKPKTTLSVVSGPQAKARYTANGNPANLKALSNDHADNFSVTGNELKLGIVGESAGPQLAPNAPGDDPIVVPGSIVTLPPCLHGCKPIIDDLKTPTTEPGGDQNPADDAGDDSNTNSGENGKDGILDSSAASVGGCSLAAAAPANHYLSLFALFIFTLPILHGLRRP